MSDEAHATIWKKGMTYGLSRSAASFKAVKIELAQQPAGWFRRHTAALCLLHFFSSMFNIFFFKGLPVEATSALALSSPPLWITEDQRNPNKLGREPQTCSVKHLISPAWLKEKKNQFFYFPQVPAKSHLKLIPLEGLRALQQDAHKSPVSC